MTRTGRLLLAALGAVADEFRADLEPEREPGSPIGISKAVLGELRNHFIHGIDPKYDELPGGDWIDVPASVGLALTGRERRIAELCSEISDLNARAVQLLDRETLKRDALEKTIEALRSDVRDFEIESGASIERAVRDSKRIKELEAGLAADTKIIHELQDTNAAQRPTLIERCERIAGLVDELDRFKRGEPQPRIGFGG